MYAEISVLLDIQAWEDFFENTQVLHFLQKYPLIEPQPSIWTKQVNN